MAKDYSQRKNITYIMKHLQPIAKFPSRKMSLAIVAMQSLKVTKQMQFEFISEIQGPRVHEIKGFKDVDMVDLACKPKMLIHKIGSSSLFLTTLI